VQNLRQHITENTHTFTFVTYEEMQLCTDKFILSHYVHKHILKAINWQPTICYIL